MKSVLVVGDPIEDVYIHGHVVGVSCEQAVPVFEVEREDVSIGGAALVARNATALGALVRYVGSPYENGLPYRWCKTRFLDGGRKVFRVDTKPTTQYTSADRSRLLDTIIQALKTTAILVLADYQHGLLDAVTTQRIILAANARGVPSVVSWQTRRGCPDSTPYTQADIVVLNVTEWQQIDPTLAIGRQWCVRTLGDGGCEAWPPRTPVLLQESAIPTMVVDATGAGDAFLAALAVAYDSSATENFRQAVRFANRWAALSCTVLGPEPPSIKDLL